METDSKHSQAEHAKENGFKNEKKLNWITRFTEIAVMWMLLKKIHILKLTWYNKSLSS